MLDLPPTLITLPAGDRTISSLRSKLSLVVARSVLSGSPEGLSPDRALAFRNLQRMLQAELRRDPARVRRALLNPDALPGLLCLVSGGWPAAEAIDEAVPHLLGALGTLPEALIWPGPVRRLLAPSEHGPVALELPTPARSLLIDPSGLAIETESGREDLTVGDDRWVPAGAPLGGGVLALRDTNPLFALEAHPDKEGNALDLGGREVSEWCQELDAALQIVATALPDWAAELPMVLQRAVPVGFEPQRHLSASYREAPGRIYLTLHPSRLTLAEAIVHECQHGKLNLLTWLDPVLRNGHTHWTPSPVRPDLRPLMGVLLAVHAFVPVSALHRRMVEAGHALADGPVFARRQREVLAGNERGLRIVEEAMDPTPTGARLIAELRALHDCLVAAAGGVPDLDVMPHS